MKLIGLLGGTSWPSTIDYYRLLNQMAAETLGGDHSANLLLRSIDYHPFKSRYHGGWDELPGLLEREIEAMQELPCECLILCNNTLHKAFDIIKPRLKLHIPFFHAAELTAKHAKEKGYKHLLLLATRFTMEDGFYAATLEAAGLKVTIPTPTERAEIQAIQTRLAKDEMRPEFLEYFRDLLGRYSSLDAAVLACTELPLAVRAEMSPLALINPARLQCEAAMAFALEDNR